MVSYTHRGLEACADGIEASDRVPDAFHDFEVLKQREDGWIKGFGLRVAGFGFRFWGLGIRFELSGSGTISRY